MTENSMEVDEKKEVVKKRRRKQKAIGGLVLAFLVIVILYVFRWSKYEMPNAVDDLNKNIDLPYEFTMPISKYTIEKKWEDVGGEEGIYIGTNDVACYGFYGYPDYSSTFKFTYYYTNNWNISLFGFRVGDGMEKVNKELEKHGYKCRGIDSQGAEYQRGEVEIWVGIQLTENVYEESEIIKGGVVSEYIIRLINTDKQHKKYYK